MLEVFPNSTSDDINKDLGLTQALAKEGFEFFLDDGDINLIFHLPLILLPAKQSGIFEKSSGK